MMNPEPDLKGRYPQVTTRYDKNSGIELSPQVSHKTDKTQKMKESGPLAVTRTTPGPCCQKLPNNPSRRYGPLNQNGTHMQHQLLSRKWSMEGIEHGKEQTQTNIKAGEKTHHRTTILTAQSLSSSPQTKTHNRYALYPCTAQPP